EGRYWLQLEWRALAAALQGDKSAIDEALAFRAKRYSLFPNAEAEERALEFREGLAEYTGTALAEPSLPGRVPHLLKMLRDGEKKPTFVRSFAYVSGPAWGAIRETRHVEPAGERPVHPEKYGGAELLASEKVREEKKQAMLRDFRVRFIDGPVLVLPLRKFS